MGSAPHHQLVRELEQREPGLQLVEPTALAGRRARENPEEEVDLRVRGHVHALGGHSSVLNRLDAPQLREPDVAT